ncbi:MAG: hypothetical protein JW718_09630 [Desulfovibrionaceae bacterium]|nr:hypothetical protein [Desulfovibrionaceae bacterium]
MLDAEYLKKLEDYIRSGDLAFDFENGDEERRGRILDFLERIMDLAELADQTATRLIFKDGYLEMLSGVSAQK